MFRRYWTRLTLAASLLFVSTALAATLQEVTDDADSLDAAYTSLAAEVDACPAGACPEAAALVSEFDALEADRSQLNADRASLSPCSACSSVDLTISDVGDLADSVASTIGEWNEEQ